MSYAILWVYEVAPGQEGAFRDAYGPDGAWASLFSCAAGFVGVELLDNGERFVTIDRWDSQAAFDAFQAAHGAVYEALDKELAPLTRS